MSDPTDPRQSQPDDSRQPPPQWQPPGPPSPPPPPPPGVPPQGPPPGWQPPGPPWQPPGGPPPRRQAWPRRHPVWTAMLSTFAIIIVIGVVAAVAAPKPKSNTPNAASSPASEVTDPAGNVCLALDGQGYCPGDDPSSAAPTTAAPTTPAPTTAAAPTMTKQTDIVVFKVSGSAYPSILYGTDSSNNQVPGGNGPLGDGVALPWSASMPYDSGALYYFVTAQLEGGGSIADSITEVITTKCSGQPAKTESFPLANGNASGGYAIAQAEYTGGDTGNAMQAESDAGC